MATAQDHDQLVSLVYELLDAHHDTAQIARDLLPPDPDWDAHLEYLRALQRTARCVLASVSRTTAAETWDGPGTQSRLKAPP